ncbi:MAG: hypothetical protein ABIH23_07225 [bacterium]
MTVRILASITLFVGLAVFFVLCYGEFSSSPDKGGIRTTEVTRIKHQDPILGLREEFKEVLDPFTRLSDEKREALLSLYCDIYQIAADGERDPFLIDWIKDSLYRDGSHYLDPNEPMVEMNYRFDSIRARVRKTLSIIGSKPTKEMREKTEGLTNQSFVCAERLLIDFVNSIDNVRVEKQFYRHIYESKSRAPSNVGQDFIRGASNALFAPDFSLDSFVLGIGVIASIGKDDVVQIKEKASLFFETCL